MSQAESDPNSFAAFATFLGTPLPENPIRALRILRAEAAREIERLIVFLDATGVDPDLEDGHADEEEPDEPSLGWTSTLNQTSRNRLGEGGDLEQDDSDREEIDEGEDDGTAEHEPDAEPNGDEEDFSRSPSPEYMERLRARRGQQGRGLGTVFLVGPDGRIEERTHDGYLVAR